MKPAFLRSRAAAPALPHPDTCRGCPLDEKGLGYAPADGPTSSPLLLVGEALGYEEMIHGRPFVGTAGSMLTRLLRRVSVDREACRVDNVVRCQPPKNWLAGAPWERGAVAHCTRVHLADTLREPHQVVVPLGASAIRAVLGVYGKHTGPESFHGTVTQLPSGHWVVPTFHPSHLARGATNLLGVVQWDLLRALAVQRGEHTPQPLTLIEDPPIDWFRAWADQYLLAAAADPWGAWLATDCETPDKAGGRDESELTEDDQSYQILRVNLACHPDEGITVPFVEPYISIIREVHSSLGVKVGWNLDYDEPRYDAAKVPLSGAAVYDMMKAAHILQSDLPLGLGFWAPFYSNYGAWKHLSGERPVLYACIDGPQTLRVAFGLADDLIKSGQWEAYARHCDQLDRRVLKPAAAIGVPVDRPRLTEFTADLEVKSRRLLHQLQGHVPEACRPLTGGVGNSGFKVRPQGAHAQASGLTQKGLPRKTAPDILKQELYAQVSVLVEREVVREIGVCGACGAEGIAKSHRCADRSLTPRVSKLARTVTRWFWHDPFNPDSPDQVIAVMRAKGHQPGKSKTSDESANRQALEANLAKTKDPFYKDLLAYRAITKVRSTYALKTMALLDADSRLHPHFKFRPSTQRLSCAAPNIQNVVSRDAGEENLAAGFRRTVVPAVGCRLLEVDFSAIEAVLVGWFARSPNYIRLAKQGVHAGLASHAIGEPYDPTWDDATLADYLTQIKKRTKTDASDSLYDICKRVVHGSAYLLTAYGMQRNFPAQFPTVAKADKLQKIYYGMAPDIPAWQQSVQKFAYDHGYLGGPGDPPFGHPYAYKHWFWAVTTFQALDYAAYLRRQKRAQPTAVIGGKYFAVIPGDDAKRAVAFFPQSTGAGVLKDAMLALHDPDGEYYVGDAYFGRTPLRAPIHDSLLFEVPLRAWDRVLERVVTAMTAPILAMPNPVEWGLGAHLTIGVEAKAGADWSAMEKIALPQGVAEPDAQPEESEEEWVADLGTVA